MSLKELEHIINQGESEILEFKTSFNKEVIETIVAFSNTKGGQIIIGINNKKEIVGTVINLESIQNWINEIKNTTYPQLIPEVDTFSVSKNTVVIFKIKEFPIKPVSYKKKYFKRIANSNHLMDLNEIANEHLKTINSSWDFQLDPNHNLDDISVEKVAHFIRRIEKRTNKDNSETQLDFLKKLEIIRADKITFGAYLLFAKEYCSISDIQVGRFKSDITIIDNISLDTDLFTETEEIISFIKKHLMVEYIITDKQLPRIERFDYPLDAIREIVINMIEHRDYRNSSASIIKIFDDKIEFYNPGKLFENISINDLLSNNYTSKSRNKLIAKAFKEVGLIERYGSGIKRVISICKNHGIIPPKFDEIFDGFRVVLFKKKINDTVNDTLNKRDNQIIQLISNNKNITIHDISITLTVSEITIKRALKKLVKNKFIERIGSDKTGYWSILNLNK